MPLVYPTRRAFLKAIVLSAGATMLPLSFPGSILADNDPDLQNQLHRPFPPHYARGTLIDRSTHSITIEEPNATPSILTLMIEPTTKIYRKHPNAPLASLQLGDRIDAGTLTGHNGQRVATWIQANTIIDWGVVKAMKESTITVEPDPEQTYMHVERDLEFLPGSFFHGLGGEQLGGFDGLTVGDYVYYTAFADTPDMSIRKMWVYRIFKMIDEDGTSS